MECIENILFSKFEQKRLYFEASPQANYLFQEEIQKKIVFQGQFAKKRTSCSRIMAEIPNQGVKSRKKLSDSIKNQKKDIFIFCISQKMNLFKKTKEKRYFRPASDEGAPGAGPRMPGRWVPDAALSRAGALGTGPRVPGATLSRAGAPKAGAPDATLPKSAALDAGCRVPPRMLRRRVPLCRKPRRRIRCPYL